MAVRNTLLGGTDWEDDSSTTLDGAINDSVTTITVVSTTGFKSAGSILINSELIDYTGTTATTFTGCTRGQYGTSAASHSDTDDVFEKEVLKSQDLNDTFDEIFEQASTNIWYLNSNFYDVYDDFSAYSADDDVATENPTDWSASLTGSGSYTSTFKAKTSTKAGGAGNEGELRASSTANDFGNATAIAKLINLSANKHTFMRAYGSIVAGGSADSHNANISISFDGGATYFDLLDCDSNFDDYSVTCLSQIMVVAKGSDEYDCYVGGKMVDNVTDATFEIWLRSNVGGNPLIGVEVKLYIDDVRQTTYEVS